jgi:hypothetical protein
MSEASGQMFLRPHQRSKDGREHTYWSLVETVRTVGAPRQRTLYHLGELNGSAQARWLKSVVPKLSASGAVLVQPLSPMKALALLSALQSADIVMPATDGREIRLRRITEPTGEQKSLLHQIGLSLPERLKSLSKCSSASWIIPSAEKQPSTAGVGGSRFLK